MIGFYETRGPSLAICNREKCQRMLSKSPLCYQTCTHFKMGSSKDYSRVRPNWAQQKNEVTYVKEYMRALRKENRQGCAELEANMVDLLEVQ